MYILVIDDEESFANLLGRLLRRLGHEVAVRLDPWDALATFRAEKFDAVITDIDMPRMSGVELAREIRSDCATMPIAFCTGSSRADDAVREAAELGPVHAKICRPSDLERLLRDLCDAPVP